MGLSESHVCKQRVQSTKYHDNICGRHQNLSQQLSIITFTKVGHIVVMILLSCEVHSTHEECSLTANAVPISRIISILKMYGILSTEL
jgi:hypothetical protein